MLPPRCEAWCAWVFLLSTPGGLEGWQEAKSSMTAVEFLHLMTGQEGAQGTWWSQSTILKRTLAEDIGLEKDRYYQIMLWQVSSEELTGPYVCMNCLWVSCHGWPPQRSYLWHCSPLAGENPLGSKVLA